MVINNTLFGCKLNKILQINGNKKSIMNIFSNRFSRKSYDNVDKLKKKTEFDRLRYTGRYGYD